jgi:4-hydroxybenzoate polyprenyltransferase
MTPTQPDYKRPNTRPKTWAEIVRLLRWHKPEGRLILMVPALWAAVLASRAEPPALLLLIIVAGTLATSAAGCVVNDLWDRTIDPQVERTRTRPLAAKTLTLQVGAIVALVSFLCAFGLSLYLKPLSFWLCVAAVPVIVLYPLAKRVFPVPQLVLSLAWGFAVLISWSAVTGSLSEGAWLLWGATVFWTLGFDTIYAMPDRPDDRRLRVNSSALFFGRYVEGAIAVFLFGTVVLLGVLGISLHLHAGYWIGLVAAAALWSREVWMLRRSAKLPPKIYGQLFRENVWIGFILLAGMVFGYRL